MKCEREIRKQHYNTVAHTMTVAFSGAAACSNLRWRFSAVCSRRRSMVKSTTTTTTASAHIDSGLKLQINGSRRLCKAMARALAPPDTELAADAPALAVAEFKEEGDVEPRRLARCTQQLKGASLVLRGAKPRVTWIGPAQASPPCKWLASLLLPTAPNQLLWW